MGLTEIMISAGLVGLLCGLIGFLIGVVAMLYFTGFLFFGPDKPIEYRVAEKESGE